MLEIINLLLPGVTKILDKIIPDANKRAEAIENIQAELLKQDGAVQQAIADAAKAQMEINLEEAKHASLFVAGWRPAVGWICVGGLGYQFLLQPFVTWFSTMIAIPVPPTLDIASLMTLVTGMLGLGALRSYDKLQGTASLPANAPKGKQ